MPLPAIQTRSTFLPFAKPDVDQREIDAVSEVIASGWLTTGPKTREFESTFAARVGASRRHLAVFEVCRAEKRLLQELAQPALAAAPSDWAPTPQNILNPILCGSRLFPMTVLPLFCHFRLSAGVDTGDEVAKVMSQIGDGKNSEPREQRPECKKRLEQEA